jgi:hypothetical protein
VIAAPALLLALLSLQLLQRQRERRRLLSRDAVALREVDEKLDRARVAASRGDAQAALGLLTSALKGTLETRLGEPVGGMTLRVLEAQLRTRGLAPKLVERAIGQLGALERARFDPGAQGALELSRALEGVRSLSGEIRRARLPSRPRSADQVDGAEPRPTRGREAS